MQRCWPLHAVGRLLGVPEQFIARHPFPGPGLAVRVIGDVTQVCSWGWDAVPACVLCLLLLQSCLGLLGPGVASLPGWC